MSVAVATTAAPYPRRVRLRGTAAAVATVLVTVAAPGLVAAQGSVQKPVARTGPSPTPVSTRATPHSVPPAAPKPTDSANSPAVPDPHPPRGGIGPLGEPVGGNQLLSRKLVLPKGAPPLPGDLTAQAFVLVDLDNGNIIAARDPHGRYQPASIQKLLTSITVLPLLPGKKKVLVSRTAAETEGSHAGLVGGGTYTVDEIFRGLLLVSGNDAAAALAEAAGGRARTVTMMNREAQSLGAYDTFIQTPSGLDGWQQLTSAYDMALFLRATVDEPRLLAYDTVAKATLPAQHIDGFGTVPLYNQNEQFLTTVHGALFAKTGYTDAAQHTFAGAIERQGHRYGVVLMRAQRYPDDQWIQAKNLVAWGLKLRAGTAPVGHLADAVAPGPPTSGGTSSGAPGSHPGSATAASDRNSSPSGVLRILAAVVLLGAMLVLARRARRARRPLRAPRR